MYVEDIVRVINPDSFFFNYTGTIESIRNDIYTVLINFDYNKIIRQDFSEKDLELIAE